MDVAQRVSVLKPDWTRTFGRCWHRCKGDIEIYVKGMGCVNVADGEREREGHLKPKYLVIVSRLAEGDIRMDFSNM
jgi:hypothetical protein